MKIKLNVKDKSVMTFLSERLLEYKPEEGRNSPMSNSAYNLMKDEMFFKKDCGITVGEIVVIELFDRSESSRKQLVNIYTYKAEQYDDIAIKMVLENFVVKADSNGGSA